MEVKSSPQQEDPANPSSRIEDGDNANTPPNNKPVLIHKDVALEEQEHTAFPDISGVGDATNSGIRGTTSSIVKSGMPGGPTRGGPTAMEFAIAALEGGRPAYHRAILIKSDEHGKYEVPLPPGKYWIGPKAKALDPVNYVPNAISFSERVVVVKEGTFTPVDLSAVGLAP
jgi:hypothetical protein